VIVAVEKAPIAAVEQVRLHHTGTGIVLEALVLNHRVVLFAAAEALKADYTVFVGSALVETVVADSVAEPALETGHTEAVAAVLVNLEQVESNQC
jgi:UDP-N-acetylglucosamine transferase subunit ALG13